MPSCLSTGGDRDPFLPKILEAIHRADEIELAVAFIKSSGLELIFSALSDAITNRGVRLTVLTSDYLDVTDPQALRKLMLLSERGASIRLFESGRSESFHLKAYIFLRAKGENSAVGTAFVGSSNISRTALTDGIEWNYQVGTTYGSEDNKESNLQCLREIRAEYQLLLNHPNVTELDYSWIDAYEDRRKVYRFPVAPGSNDAELPVPNPNDVQREALSALADSRAAGYVRGLVVMATGLGKTYLAAFDADQINARKVLFVAHREEILLQAEDTFQRIYPRARVGQYTGTQKDKDSDLLFASIQTLGKSHHLEQFSSDHFDYVVVDEFHHAAASTYRKLLGHFRPRFLLGLTATPDRTDQSDILSLCDDNLVFTQDLFHGIKQDLLCPFTYYGIYDESVNYQEIPWRNGRFDPDVLSSKLATLARARHALNHWRDKAQRKTLGFCVSIKHAKFMAQRFSREGIVSVAVYRGSDMDRSEALEKLGQGEIDIIFSVDLFNEGVDLPAIDTVMMLRPTESKVLFIQQLGRGLRKHPKKERLVVLDFIGNHKAFLNKPQALLGIQGNYQALAEFARASRENRIDLPPGCYVNYDIEIVDFLSALVGEGPSREYQALRDSLGRRPTLAEYYRSGTSLQRMRKQYGHWWELLKAEGDLSKSESRCLDEHSDFFREVEITTMVKSFKAITLEALLDSNGFHLPMTIESLAFKSLDVFRRRRSFIVDIKMELRNLDNLDEKAWLSYWKGNPINAWTGGNKSHREKPWFKISEGYFQPSFSVKEDISDTFNNMVREIVDYRLAAYEPRLASSDGAQGQVLQFNVDRIKGTELPYFPNLRIACGYFREGRTDSDEYRWLRDGHGKLDPARHFIARAVGESMNGGKRPVRDGDYLLLEHIDSNHAGSITGNTMVVERQNASGDDQYVLRLVTKTEEGKYILKATNPAYTDYEADEGMRTLARLKAVLGPLELAVGQEFMREDIPTMFGEEFNVGKWNSGHVLLKDSNAHVLLVTINKQGKAAHHRYHDYFLDERRFHWQSQNSTKPESKRGRELIEHEKLGISIHLFIRENKLANGKAAPFRYYGPVRYQTHEGSAPMSVVWQLES